MSYEVGGYTCFTFNFDLVEDCKHFPREWYNLSKHSKEIILDEIFYWDGSIKEGKFGICKSYSTSKKEDADFIMFVINSLGYSSNVREDKRYDKINYEIRYNNISSALVKKHPKDKGMFLSPAKKGDRCYCFTVDSGMLIVRRNNKIFISSNCSGTGNLEKFLTDEELSHCILNTIVYAEKTTLKGLYEGRVKAILPSDETTDDEGCMPAGDALSEGFNKELADTIEEVRKEAKSRGKKLVVIGLENPPYAEPQSESTRGGKTQKGSYENYVTKEMKKEVKGKATVDLANKFIWSGFKYFFDYYVVYSPVKYFKSQGLINKEFNEGVIVNRKDFHATEAGISIMSWKNEDAANDSWQLENCLVKKTNKGIGKLLPALKEKNWEVSYTSYSGTPDFKNGYLASSSKGAGNAGGVSYCLVNDELKKRLPLFAANCYTCKDYTEKEVIMKSGDGGTAYQNDNEFLEDCFIWCCLTDKNKCWSGASQNEMALSQNSKADQIVDLKQPHRLALKRSWDNVLNEAKQCKEYNSNWKYGLAQIINDLNLDDPTDVKNKKGQTLMQKRYRKLDAQITSFKEDLKEFYDKYIKDKLFQYELLK